MCVISSLSLVYFSKFFLVRFPLYYELKIAFVIWLLSPYTKGASLIYRKFLHPLLSSKERVRYVNYLHKSFVRNVYHHMLYAIQLVKCLYYGGGFLFFGFLMLHLSIINVYGFGFFFFSRRLMIILYKQRNEAMRRW